MTGLPLLSWTLNSHKSRVGDWNVHLNKGTGVWLPRGGDSCSFNRNLMRCHLPDDIYLNAIKSFNCPLPHIKLLLEGQYFFLHVFGNSEQVSLILFAPSIEISLSHYHHLQLLFAQVTSGQIICPFLFSPDRRGMVTEFCWGRGTVERVKLPVAAF